MNIAGRSPLITTIPVVAQSSATAAMPAPPRPRPISPPAFPKCAKDTLSTLLQTVRQHMGKLSRTKIADFQPRIDNELFCLQLDRRQTRLTAPTDQLRLLQIFAEFFTTVDKENPNIRYQLFDVIFLGREGEGFLHEIRITVLAKLCIHMVQFGPYSFYADVAQWLNRISSGSGKNYARGIVTDMVNSYMTSPEKLKMYEFLLPLREYAVEFTVYFLIFAIQAHEPARPWAILFTNWLEDDCTPFFAVMKENSFLAREFATTTFNLIARFDFKNEVEEDLRKAYHGIVMKMYDFWRRLIGSSLNVVFIAEIFAGCSDLNHEEQQKLLEHFSNAFQTRSLPVVELKKVLDELPKHVVAALPKEMVSCIENGVK